MSIRLTFYMSKNKVSLERLCKQFDISSYDELVEYCAMKRFKCDVSQKEFDAIFKKEKVVKNETSKPKTIAKPAPKTRRRGRKPKVKKDGNANKKSSS